MNLKELKRRVDQALSDCQNLINQNPSVILSEADFERILSNYITTRIGYVPMNPIPDSFSVHTQISHYHQDNDKVDVRVDILLFKGDQMLPSDVNKRFYFEGDSLAIELKYLHTNNYQGVVQNDFDKEDKIGNDSWLYIVVLLDSNDKTSFSAKKNEIIKMWKNQIVNSNCKGKLFCKVLKRELPSNKKE